VGDGGETAALTLTCPRDGTPTRLRCAECQAPICPSCYVRTPVGLRCPDCAVSSVPAHREAEDRPRWLVPALVAVLVAVGVAGAMALSGGGGDEEPALPLGERAVQAPASERVRIGTGDMRFGRWVLEGRRREGGICGTLALEPGPPGQERCHPIPGDEAILSPLTIRIRTDSETFFLTHGPVSERTARVRVAPEGSTPWEVPALGAAAGLGGRFFVVLTTSGSTTFTALATDGTELGRTSLVPPPGS
jgi:hypothetical protein